MTSFGDLLEREYKSLKDYKVAVLEVASLKLELERAETIAEREGAEHKKYADAISSHFMGFVDSFLQGEEQ